MEERQKYFEESLQNFARDFAYGGAIRHLVDHGYSADRIIREFHYPLPRAVIERMVADYEQEKKGKEQRR